MSKDLFHTERQAEVEDAILDAEYSEYLYYQQENEYLVSEYELRQLEENSITYITKPE